MKRILWLFALALVVASCATTDHGMPNSPKREYVAELKDTEADVNELRVLVIRKRDQTASVFKLAVRRDVKLVWEPAGNAVGIIDEFASNENRLIVVGLPKGDTRAEVSRANLGKWGSGLDGKQYSHVYIGNLEWKDGDLLADVNMYNRLTDSGPSDCHGKIQLSRDSMESLIR